eukprot:9149_1
MKFDGKCIHGKGNIWHTKPHTMHSYSDVLIYYLGILMPYGGECCICKIPIYLNEFLFVCDCEDDIGFQQYCVWCVQSMMVQYRSIKSLLYEFLNDILDGDCIQQIVMFCAGKVESVDKQCKESNRIDDTKTQNALANIGFMCKKTQTQMISII